MAILADITSSEKELSINGGKPVRVEPWSNRFQFDSREKNAVMALFDKSIESGAAFGYNGLPEQQYEKDFVDFMEGGFADGVNSGTNAVFVAIGALNLEPFSEIIVPPITDAGGVMPTIFCGCVPVFADTSKDSFNIGAEQIEKVITERTKAILVAHISGIPAEMDAIMALAKKHNLYVIEDCAQAHGATYKGRKVGTIGDIAAFSTMFGKHHCTGGQGGVVYTTNKDLHWQARRFADRGKPFNCDAGSNVRAGLNCNLNDISATIGSVQIKKLPDIINKRVALYEKLRKGLETVGGISLMDVPKNSQSVHWFTVLKYDKAMMKVDKDTFVEALAAEGIPADKDYCVAFQPGAKWIKEKNTFGSSGFPWTCTDYKGSRNPEYVLDNVVQALDEHFRIATNEGCGDKEADDIICAIKKVASVYSK